MTLTPVRQPYGLLAATPYPAGFPLQNATPTILTWTAPNDGKQHRVDLKSTLHILTNQTGGQIDITVTFPDGAVAPIDTYPGGALAGYQEAFSGPSFIIQAGSTVTVAQVTAQTAGSSTLFAELWGS